MLGEVSYFMVPHRFALIKLGLESMDVQEQILNCQELLLLTLQHAAIRTSPVDTIGLIPIRELSLLLTL